MEPTPAAFPGGDEAREIQHAVELLVELIPDAHDDRYPPRVRHACREAFAMNARVLIDFVTQDDDRAIQATDFAGSGWTRPKRAGAVFDAWQRASQNVAHLSTARMDDLSYDITEQRMREVARLVVGLLDGWVAAVERNGHADAAALRSSVTKAQALL
jgi:hypothetical protein